ncbi:hypothetical protein Hdeb2414_s0005g00154231 [Helianthus debilis subsp. tardiflorus]
MKSENSPICAESVKIPQVFDLEELDSYSASVQVKKEPNKPSTASKPVASSKETTMPKPSPTTKPRASSLSKRKETDSPATSEAFPYENHGFLESSGFMTSFLNLASILILVNKMLEAKLKKAEVTIADQGMSTAARSQRYEDKFKAMTQEHQAAMKKATQEVQAKLDAVQAHHEQDMVSYREGLKGSVVISLLQARLKMAYEAKVTGFECPTWTIEAWEANLKDLCGAPMEYPAKPAVEASSKAAEMEVDAGDDADKDARVDLGPDVGSEAMVDEGAAA